jgi:hypothetical protein
MKKTKTNCDNQNVYEVAPERFEYLGGKICNVYFMDKAQLKKIKGEYPKIKRNGLEEILYWENGDGTYFVDFEFNGNNLSDMYIVTKKQLEKIKKKYPNLVTEIPKQN